MNPINKLLVLSASLILSTVFPGFGAAAETLKQGEPVAGTVLGPAAAPGTISDVSVGPEAPLSTSSPRTVLKHGDTLLVLDKQGMIDPRAGSPYGLYADDTRYLSCWQIKINGKAPNLLTSFDAPGWQGTFLYSIEDSGLLKRELVLLDGFNERISIDNYSGEALNLKLSLRTGSDFKDMFEVRGQKRKKVGLLHTPELTEEDHEQLLVTSYTGLDGRDYKSYVRCNRKADSIHENTFEFDLHLPARSQQVIEFRIDSNRNDRIRSGVSYADSFRTASQRYESWRSNLPVVESNWDILDAMYSRSLSDLYILQQNTPKGPCLAAGLPWFSSAFGRDQCVVGLQALAFAPQLSKELISVLAAYQGQRHDSATEEEPGKIMHELRLGEMARCKEIAFTPSYGSADATPLWLVHLARYAAATGDRKFAESLWTNVDEALAYIERCTSTTDPFLYYGGPNGGALANQGWKDSDNSIMHKDGRLARPPIAVCEVQGYVYEAYIGVAELAARLGKKGQSEQLLSKAANLKKRFRESFWLASERYVALALDGKGRTCDVISSNPGHLLCTGILDEEMAEAVSKRLLENDMCSGWGVRTLSSREISFNPISYHNGSVWPHDDGIIVEGLCKNRHQEWAAKIFQYLLDSAKTSCDDRLPELFCGFDRTEFDRPVPYPVSCVPQAWAAGSVLQMLKSVLGIRLVDNKILVSNPVLPEKLSRLTIRNLRSEGRAISLIFTREEKTGKVTVMQHFQP